MPLLTFFLRRLASAFVARHAANFASRRLNLSPGIANLLFVALTEILARSTERPAREPAGAQV